MGGGPEGGSRDPPGPKSRGPIGTLTGHLPIGNPFRIYGIDRRGVRSAIPGGSNWEMSDLGIRNGRVMRPARNPVIGGDP